MKLRFLHWGGGLLLALTLVLSFMTISASAAVTYFLVSPASCDVQRGQNCPLRADVQVDVGDPQGVTWHSEDTSIATVDANTGVVTGVSNGTVRIVATSNDDSSVTGSCTVRVVDPIVTNVPVTGISLTPSPLTLDVGDSGELDVLFQPSNASNKDFSIEGNTNPSVVSVQKTSGTRLSVTALSAGSSRITVKSVDGGFTASCVVTVRNTSTPTTPVTVTLDRHGASIPLGEALILKATVEAPDGVSKSLTWRSTNQGRINYRYVNAADTSTVEVYLTGSAKAGDEATIYATSTANPSASDVCAVRVVGAQLPKITSVEITTSPTNNGRNYVDPGVGNTLQLQAVAYPAAAAEEDRRIIWSSSDPSIATVDRNTGVVTGRSPGEVLIRATAQGDSTKYAERTVEVSGLLLSYMKKGSSGGQGTSVDLTANTEVEIFQYRDIVVSYKAFGNAQGKTINWESSNPTVAQVVNGRVTGNYPGSNVVITASAAGTACSSSFKVRVTEDVADAITVNMGTSPSYAFSNLLSQLNSRSQSKAGAPLDCVYSLKVSTKNGVLYYKYKTPETPGQGVGGTERYYYQPNGQTQRALRDVSFVPLPGFDGTAVVDYTAMATNSSTFSGTIRIEAATTGDVSYSTGVNQPVSFAAEQFSAVCQGRNGRALRYVTFTQPAASQGALYYNYSPSGQFSQKVGASTRYYASSSPSIDNVTFVPAEGFTGSVNISYRCVDSSGGSYSGTVTVRVGGGGTSTSSGGNVEYTIARNQRQTLNAGDFDSASRRVTGVDLDRIRFTSLPSSSAGTLYLNYTSSSSTRVTTGASYYAISNSPLISNITFVPASGYEGTVTVPFTGTNTSGTTFSGSLIFHVGTGGTGTVHYSVSRNQTVTLNAWDFNDASRRLTGEALASIRFNSLPASGAGVLYYGYVSATSPGSRVTAGTDYRRDGTPSLSSVTFVPASGYTGTVTIPFTGYDDRGTRFDGTLTIAVEGGGSSAGSYNVYYTGSSLPIAFQASDFQSACQAALGNPLSHVQFNSTPSVGRLYKGYSSSAQTGSVVSAVTLYTPQDLGQISYVPKAEYQGTLRIPYTMHDNQGHMASGTVGIDLSSSYCHASFSDTASGWDWAKPSIEYLRDSGITSGYRNNTYRPGQSISRGEFTLMICRAFQFPTSGSSGFPDVPKNSVYAGAIASAQRLGIVQGNNGRFQPDRPITRQSAMTMICRAIQAAGQTLPAADTGVLSSYADGSRVSSFARSSVAALIEMGAVRGNSTSRLNPGAAISRAEMAVILHRVLTR